MKIPRTIKIGGRNITIERMLSSDMEGETGSWSNWRDRIRIANDPDLSLQSSYVTLIHEIIECINVKHQYNLQHSVIQGLAENIYQVLVDNGWLTIQKETHGQQSKPIAEDDMGWVKCSQLEDFKRLQIEEERKRQESFRKGNSPDK